MSKKFQKTLTATAILVALSSATFAQTPTMVTWNSATVPQLSSQYQFSGTDVSGISGNFWSPLTVATGASGVLNNLDINIQAIGPKDGTTQDKQILGIEINGGKPEFSGDKMNVAVNTDFVGGGNNQATAIDFFSSATTTISARDVTLSVTSSVANGKSVYGIGLGSGGTLNITSKTLMIDLNTSTVRNDASANNNYSQAIGLDVYRNGLLQISEDTEVTIRVTSNGEIPTTNGTDGATTAYGILYEGGRGEIAGKLNITAKADGGNAVGVGVTNYFYNTSMGANWGSVAANLADVTVNATSTQGKAAGIEAAYTVGQTNDVILKVNGASNLTATTESGSAVGVDVSGKTSVQLDGNLTATAKATGEKGTAYSVKTSEGTLYINGAQNQLNGNVDVNQAGTLALGANSNTTVDGNITTAEGTTLKLDSAELELAAGNTAAISGTLTSADGTIVVNEVSEKPILSVAKLSGNLAVAASGALNDMFATPEEALKALKNSVNVTTDGTTSKYEFEGRSSGVADSWTANSDGEITSVTQNESLDAFENFSAMTLVAWRGENNHLTQRLGDIRDNAGNIGAWARAYGYDSEYSDVVNVNYKSNAIQVGADFRFGGNYVAGAAFSYTDGEGDFTNGSADAESYTLAAYLSGFFDCGGYFDVIGRVGRMSIDIIAANQTNVMKADYDNMTLGLSAEIGWRYNVNEMFYVEPQAELSYAMAFGDDYEATNGVKVEQDDYQSLVGRLGARIGANFADNKGSVYLTASVNHDFLGDADFTATSGNIHKDVNVDAGGTWVSYGVGAQFNTSANLNFYGSLEKSSGSEYSEDYRYNVGLRYVW